MRNHTVNPSITVLMHHIGCHQDTIGRAVRSFLNQTYNKAILIIFNWHPEPLEIQGISDNELRNILIHNAPDSCVRPMDGYKYGMKKVVTDTWTVLDDDDWMDPNHLQQLVDCWNKVNDRNDKHLRVCAPHFTAHYDDGEKDFTCGCWWVALFERMTIDQVDLVFKNFPSGRICGSDNWLLGNSFFDKRDFKGLPSTFHWLRKGDKHVSQHETRPREDTPEGLYQAHSTYWRIKIDALRSKLNPVVVPECL